MNDHELDQALAAMGQERRAVADSPELHELVRTVTGTAPGHRGPIRPFQVIGGNNMFTTMKAAAVVAVLALATSLLAVQIGGPAEPVAPAATQAGGSPVTVIGTQEQTDTSAPNRILATNAMSDERVQGDVEITWRVASQYVTDATDDALYGTITITNDGGTWQGQWVGFADDQSRHHAMAWYEGTGDYDGLRYVEQVVQREQDGLIDLTGLIFKGMAPGTVVPAEVVE